MTKYGVDIIISAMLTSILGVLILASSISSLSISDPLANSTDGIDTLRATAMDPRILDPTASTRRSPRLDRRVSIDQSCSEAAVELLTELMVEVEVIARWAVQGAPLRSSSRGGSRGGSRGTAVGGFGRGRGRNPPFADNAFRRYFSRDRTRPQATIPLAIRSYVRARFQLVAEQASRIRRPGHPEFRQDQIFRCEQEGDPRGLCRGDGAPPFIHTMAGRPGWNIIVSYSKVFDKRIGGVFRSFRGE